MPSLVHSAGYRKGNMEAAVSLPTLGIPYTSAFAAPEELSSYLRASLSTAHGNSDLSYVCAKWT